MRAHPLFAGHVREIEMQPEKLAVAPGRLRHGLIPVVVSDAGVLARIVGEPLGGAVRVDRYAGLAR